MIRGSMICQSFFKPFKKYYLLIYFAASYDDGVCQQRCRVTLKKNYFSTSSILTHRVRGLSTAITRAIQALLFRQFYVKAYIII